MTRVIRILILVLCLGPAPAWVAAVVPPRDTVRVAPATPDTLAGVWRVDDGDPSPVRIQRGADGYVLTRAGHWTGFGRLVGHRFEGEFESQRVLGDTMRVSGLHDGRFSGEGRLEVTVIYTRGRHGARHEVWRRESATPPTERALTSTESARRRADSAEVALPADAGGVGARQGTRLER